MWKRIDPQIDDFQLNLLKNWAKEHEDIGKDYADMLLNFDPQSITANDFITAGEAWIMCREEGANPKRFGIGCDPKLYGKETLYGLWFIRGNLIKDFLALNKIELIPFLSGLERTDDYWSPWRLISADDSELSEEDFKLLDKLAKLTINADDNFEEIRRTYEQHKELIPPETIIKLVQKVG